MLLYASTTRCVEASFQIRTSRSQPAALTHRCLSSGGARRCPRPRRTRGCAEPTPRPSRTSSARPMLHASRMRLDAGSSHREATAPAASRRPPPRQPWRSRPTAIRAKLAAMARPSMPPIARRSSISCDGRIEQGGQRRAERQARDSRARAPARGSARRSTSTEPALTITGVRLGPARRTPATRSGRPSSRGARARRSAALRRWRPCRPA